MNNPQFSNFSAVVESVKKNQSGIYLICHIFQGSIKVDDEVRLLPSGHQSAIRSILSQDETIKLGYAADQIIYALKDELIVAKGDVLCSLHATPQIASQFEVKVLCKSDEPFIAGRQYLMHIAEKNILATVTEIKYKIDVSSNLHLAAKSLYSHDIGVLNLSTQFPIVFEPYNENPRLGSFYLSDVATGNEVGTGTINFALRRASNIHWQALAIDKNARAKNKNQHPMCVWFTGLSGSGKSTIANFLEKKLFSEGKHTYILDGDNVRHGLNKDLGFTESDRVENIRRVGEVAKLMVDAGLIVLVSFISPFRSERRMVRDLFIQDEFIDVYIDTSIEDCEQRDVKGLYAKARKGELKNFTGIDSPYEPPESPDIHIKTIEISPEKSAEIIMKFIGSKC